MIDKQFIIQYPFNAKQICLGAWSSKNINIYCDENISIPNNYIWIFADYRRGRPLHLNFSTYKKLKEYLHDI